MSFRNEIEILNSNAHNRHSIKRFHGVDLYGTTKKERKWKQRCQSVKKRWMCVQQRIDFIITLGICSLDLATLLMTVSN